MGLILNMPFRRWAFPGNADIFITVRAVAHKKLDAETAIVRWERIISQRLIEIEWYE